MRRVLLDENLPRLLKRELSGLDVRTVAEAGWAGIASRPGSSSRSNPPGGPRPAASPSSPRTTAPSGAPTEPSLYDTLLVTVHSTLLPPGRYRVHLETLAPQGRTGATGEIPFRVLPPA